MAVSVPGAVRTGAPWLLAVPFFLFSTPDSITLTVGGGVATIGLALRAWAAGTIRKDEALATTGPYALTRNPLYLGSFLIGLGIATGGGSWLWPVLFAVGFGGLYVPTMAREAEALAVHFGARYAEYAQAVPHFLPRLRRPAGWREDGAAGGDFTWQRYLRHREWEALLGVCAAFAVLVVRMRWSA